MEYGFLDEAGDVGVGPRSSRVLVVTVVLTAAPQSLRREVKKFRTRLRKKKRQIPELKASQSVPAWNRKRLERLAKLDIEVVVVAAEKTAHSRSQEPEELYRILCARAVEECLRRFPALTLRVDKRYTNPTLRAAQEQALRLAVEQPGRTLTIEQADSAHDPALQQADLVAWAFLQKYTRGDDSFAALVQDRVVVETVLRGW
jgi:hypothetical protein